VFISVYTFDPLSPMRARLIHWHSGAKPELAGADWIWAGPGQNGVCVCPGCVSASCLVPAPHNALFIGTSWFPGWSEYLRGISMTLCWNDAVSGDGPHRLIECVSVHACVWSTEMHGSLWMFYHLILLILYVVVLHNVILISWKDIYRHPW